MGVIRRQGLKNVILNYFGVAIGLFSVLFIYPMETEAYGLARFLMDSAVLFIPLSTLGAIALPVRFFPKFENPANGHHGFISWLLLICLIGAGVTSLITWLFWDHIMLHYASVSSLYVLYLYFFLPILILRGSIQVLSMFISNFQRIVVPSLLNDILIKLSLPVFILLIHWDIWSYKELIVGIMLNFIVVLGGMLYYLAKLDQLTWKIDWQVFKGPILKNMGTYATYGLLGSMGASIAVNLDVFMIGSMISPQATGIYGIASIMASLVNRPLVAITAIAGPIIMKAWENNDQPEVFKIYEKSSLNSLAPGALIFLLIILNLDDIYAIMPNSQLIGQNKLAIILLGVAYLLNLITGANSEIMAYSKLFKWNFYAVLVLAGINFCLNWVFIRSWGISGAAFATMISYLIYNIFKSLVIYCTYGMHPFSSGLFRLMLLIFTTLALGLFIPVVEPNFLAIILRTSLISGFYIWALYFFNISQDINELISKILKFKF